MNIAWAVRQYCEHKAAVSLLCNEITSPVAVSCTNIVLAETRLQLHTYIDDNNNVMQHLPPNTEIHLGRL